MLTLWREFRILYRTVRRSLHDRILDLASSIAFYAFFGVFPLLLLVGAVASYLLGSEQVQSQLYRLVDESFPAGGDLVRDTVRSVTGARGRMGTAGIIGLLWAVGAAFGAVTRAINFVMRNERPRSLVWARFRYTFLALTVSTLLVVSVAVSSVVELLVTTDRPWLTLPGVENEFLIWIVGWTTSFLVMLLAFTLVYKGAPTSPTRWRTVFPGAVLAAVITEVGKIGFLGYLERVANLEAVFGSLTSIMVLLLWLFLAAVALVLGVEYNVVRGEQN